MNVERLLQISIAVLLSLGTLLRSPGQKDLLVPLLVFVAAAVSIYVTDTKKWIRLSHRLATGVALLTVVIPLRNFFVLDSAAQLLAIAKLLTYLQLILLFQEKTPRIYWQLFMLSVLQVVVGAALNVSVIFGLLLVLYMFVGLFALTLFFVYREAPRNAGNTPTAGADRSGPIAQPHGAASNGRSKPRLLLAPTGFWSGAGKDPSWARAARQAWQQAATVGAGSLLITALLFIAAPRTGKSDWTAATEAAANPITGFSPSVQLGDIGTISQNSHPVMRVKLTDESGTPLALNDQPLFRGQLLNYYSRGGWSYKHAILPYRTRQQQLVRVTDDRPYVRQEITIEPLNEDILFAIFNPLRVGESPYVRWEPQRMRLYRPQRRTEDRITYVLGTSGIYQGRQWPLVPQFGPYDGPETGLPRLGTSDQDLPGEVKAVADRVLREADVPAENRLAQTNALLAYLRDSGTFEYTLERSARNPNIDPIVDFLRNNRRGHCEYFATALCLMLRSQGIPARLVAGFYGDWNPLTQDYQVRQLHAHTWVEAYLEAEQVPPDLLRPDLELGPGGWLTLDPTPGVVIDPATRRGLFAPLSNALDYTQIMWITYVVGLNKSFQYETIYGPVAQWVTSTGRWIGGEIRDTAIHVWKWLSPDSTGLQENLGRMAARIVVALIAIGLIIASCVYAVRLSRRWRLRRVIRAMTAGRPAAQRAIIEFYCRMEELLARRGLARAASQTPHEFAVSIAPDLALWGAGLSGRVHPEPPHAKVESPRRIADLPRQIVDAFYRARYSGRPLDKAELRAVEKALSELEHTISDQR